MRLKQLITLVAVMSLSVCAFAQTDTSSMYQKPLFDFEYNKPVFKLDNEQATNKRRFLRFSALTKYREGVKPIEGPFGTNFQRLNDPTTGTARLAMYNLSIADLLKHYPTDPEMVVLKVKDPSKYIYDPKYGDKTDWMRKNAYCFEYTFPDALMNIDIVDRELARLFKVKLSNEKRMINNQEVTVMVIEEVGFEK